MAEPEHSYILRIAKQLLSINGDRRAYILCTIKEVFVHQGTPKAGMTGDTATEEPTKRCQHLDVRRSFFCWTAHLPAHQEKHRDLQLLKTTCQLHKFFNPWIRTSSKSSKFTTGRMYFAPSLTRRMTAHYQMPVAYKVFCCIIDIDTISIT